MSSSHLPTASTQAFYFVWMDFFSVCLVVPAVLGFLVWFMRPADENVDNDGMHTSRLHILDSIQTLQLRLTSLVTNYLLLATATNVYFAGMMVCWAFLFRVLWRRQVSVQIKLT